MRVTVAVDCMGGDYGPSVTVPAALALLRDDADAGVILVGLAADIEFQLKQIKSAFGDRLVVRQWCAKVAATACRSVLCVLSGDRVEHHNRRSEAVSLALTCGS